jgi:hypothetical protein
MNYHGAETFFAKRRSKSDDERRYTHNQWIGYNEREDYYWHRHHNTVTVRIYRDKYLLSTGGWDTVTTWKKMHDIAPFNTTRAYGRRYVDDRFLVWRQDDKRLFTPWYDGIEVDYHGAPLKPQPVRVWQLKKGVMKPFNDMVKRLRGKTLHMRMEFGEFDFNADDSNVEKPWEGTELLEKLRELDVQGGEWLKSEDVAPLFIPRPRVVFGRQRRTVYTKRTGMQLLQTSLNAARSAFVEELIHPDGGWRCEMEAAYEQVVLNQEK